MQDYMVVEVDANNKPVNSMKVRAVSLLDAQEQYATTNKWNCVEFIVHEINVEGNVASTGLVNGQLYSFQIPF